MVNFLKLISAGIPLLPQEFSGSPAGPDTCVLTFLAELGGPQSSVCRRMATQGYTQKATQIDLRCNLRLSRELSITADFGT